MFSHRQSHSYSHHHLLQQPTKRWSCTIDVFNSKASVVNIKNDSTNGNSDSKEDRPNPNALAVLAHQSHSHHLYKPQRQGPLSDTVFGRFTNGDGFSRHSQGRPLSSFALRSSADSISLLTTIPMFDPNDEQYRCFCGQSHSTTGVRIIAGMLCLSVLYELWQLCWQFFIISPSSSKTTLFDDGFNSTVISWYDMTTTSATITLSTPEATETMSSSLFQLLFGLFIVCTVMLSLWRENSALLLPYMLLQAVGLGAVFIIFLALLYIVLDNDLDTIRTLVDTYGPIKISTDHNVNNKINGNYIIYMGWFLCASCLCLLALQLWLLSIVFACWRYFRDKKCFFADGTDEREQAVRDTTMARNSSALIVLHPINNTNNLAETTIMHPTRNDVARRATNIKKDIVTVTCRIILTGITSKIFKNHNFCAGISAQIPHYVRRLLITTMKNDAFELLNSLKMTTFL